MMRFSEAAGASEDALVEAAIYRAVSTNASSEVACIASHYRAASDQNVRRC